MNLKVIYTTVLLFLFSIGFIVAQNKSNLLTNQEQSIIAISALTAKGDLQNLKKQLSIGLDAGLSINKIKECLVHTYAYCGFPRSIRGIQTFMEVLDERKAKGIIDDQGKTASAISDDKSKYERGKETLEKLSGRPQNGLKTGYAAFAPEIEVMLKEHLFADLFDRDVLTFAERELVTISVISAIGKAEPMLKSHYALCLNVGWKPEQLKEFTNVIKNTNGKKEAKAANIVLLDTLAQNK